MNKKGSWLRVQGSWLKTTFGLLAVVWLACMGTAIGQANVYVLDLAWKEMAFTNRPALGELAEIELRGIGSSDPTNLTIYLSNRAGDMLAIAEGMTATGDYARAELALNSTNLLAEFEGVSTGGSRSFDFTIWDAARSRLLASAKIEVRHNPLWESLAFTNLPALADLGLTEYLVWGAMGTNATPSATYTIDLATKNLTADGRVAVGERAAILLKNAGDANPAGILLYLSNKFGTGLALQSGLSATTNAGEALGVLNLATTNLVGEFEDSGPTAEKSLNLTVWDSARDRMLASQPIPVRNNPLASKFVDGWTNVPEEVESELLASLDGKVDKTSTNGWEVGSHDGFITGMTVTTGATAQVTTNSGGLELVVPYGGNGVDSEARASIVSVGSVATGAAQVAAAALPSSGSGKMSGDLDFGGNSATNMADMWGIGGQSRGRISFEDSLLENFTSISASDASLGNLFVRGGRVLLESTLWQMYGDNASAYKNPIQSMPVTLSTNGAWVETSHPAGGVTRLLITTTNGPHRSSGAIDVEVGGEVVYSFTPTCSGDVQQVDFPFAYASPGEGMLLTLRTVPEVLTNAPPTITALQLYTMADTNQVGRRIDTANAVYEGDSPTLPRQWANKTYVDSAADAAMDLANGETWDRTQDTDLNGHDLRRNARFVETTCSNSYAMLYGGGAVVEIDGEGSQVIPEIIGFEVDVGETATLTVYSYSGGATNLLPEVSTNLDTWTRLDASAIVSATNTDAYTARVVFTNADATAVFVRLVDVSGGEGVPVTKFTGGVSIGGVTRTNWPGNGTGATQLIANISGQAAKTSTYDEATATLTITDLPDNNSGGGGTSITYNVASESAPCDYSWTNMGGTNYVTVSFGTNGWNQRVPDAIWTNPVVITVSPKTSSSNDACAWLRYTKGGQQLAWNTANGAISTNDIPTSSTTDVTRLRLFSTAGKTNISIRRDY